jgi:hypothetical protein
MPDEPEVEEHPTITLADKVGQKVAEHVTRASAANAATETARRHASTVAIAESLRNDLKPAMAEYFGTIIEQLPDDDPTRKFYELFMSPESVLNDAVINIMGFVGMIIACISETGKVFFQPLLNELWSSRPRMPMSPADVANAVVQGYMTMEEGQIEAAYSGLDKTPFDTMVKVTGMPPSPQDLFQMFRRNIIPEGTSASQFPSVYAGLAEGHTKDTWIKYFQKLAYVWPSPIDFVNAAVREQIPYDTAARWAAATGLDLDIAITSPPSTASLGETSGGAPTGAEGPQPGSFFDLLFDVAGRPPGPEEMARMAHRKIIPWKGTGPKATTFQQGIAESDLKTKWTAALEALSTYIPSNGEITNWVRHGFVTKADALPMYAKNAVTADVANLMMESALVDQLAEDRQLAKGEVVALYTAQHLTADEATNALAAVGYHGEQAKEILWLADFRREAQAYNRVIQVLGRQVVTGKLTVNNATQTLGAMGVPSQTITILTNDWKLARQAEVPAVTEGTIVSAAYYGVETPDQAFADLKAIGYSAYDAWRLLSVRLHGPAKIAGGEPARTQGA